MSHPGSWSALSGHLYQCSQCGYLHKRYNSCRNRHCPTCQNTQEEKWVLARQASLIDIRYYHLVFTIPAELNQFCLVYPRQMYSILFQSAWQTLDSFGWNPKYLGHKWVPPCLPTRFTVPSLEYPLAYSHFVIAQSYTWGQNLSLHPHVHCIVPGGGVTAKNKWKNANQKESSSFPSRQ